MPVYQHVPGVAGVAFRGLLKFGKALTPNFNGGAPQARRPRNASTGNPWDVLVNWHKLRNLHLVEQAASAGRRDARHPMRVPKRAEIFAH